MKEKVIMSIVVEDPTEAADSFASARKIENAAREVTGQSVHVYTNFTGNFTTLPQTDLKVPARTTRKKKE